MLEFFHKKKNQSTINIFILFLQMVIIEHNNENNQNILDYEINMWLRKEIEQEWERKKNTENTFNNKITKFIFFWKK